MRVDPEPKPKRRRTQAAREEAQAAQADKPIDPRVWIILGGLILFVALWTWLDVRTFAEAGQPSDQSIFQLVPLLLIQIFGEMPAVIILVVLGGIPFVYGVIGWLRSRRHPTP